MAVAKSIITVPKMASRRVVSNALTNWRAFSLKTGRQSDASLGGVGGLLHVSEEVRDAIATNKPVVALESTIYTHGAIGDLGLEEIVRRNGGVPAVCGILAGVPTVGLLPQEINRMIDEKAHKVSRRDIASVVGKGLLGIKEHGGTTISGTMILAQLAGIRVFATGGLGGVHRGAEDSMDISADLTELGRTRVAVVASGCKGFLDIERTLEFLETHGVVVSTFLRGRAPDQVTFPGFWARDSGYMTPSTVTDEEEAAAIIYAQEKMQIESGMLFANPVTEQDSIPQAETEAIVEQAVAESKAQGISGSQNSPFILQRIKELSQGRSVAANLSLVRTNTEAATKIAVALSKILSANLVAGKDAAARLIHSMPTRSQNSKPEMLSRADILVAGSVAVDLSCDYKSAIGEESAQPHLYTSNPARISQSVGGVGRNVALAAHRVSSGQGVRFLSRVADDLAGKFVVSSLSSVGMDVSGIERVNNVYQGNAVRTAEYIAINGSNKNLFLAMADMSIFDSNTGPNDWDRIISQSKPKWLVVDANWSPLDIASLTRAANSNGARVAFEPVSQIKSERLFHEKNHLCVFPHQSIELSTPNQYELGSMHKAATRNGFLRASQWSTVYSAVNTPDSKAHLLTLASQHNLDINMLHQMTELLPYIPTMVTKLGSKGAIVAQIVPPHDPKFRDPIESQNIFWPTLALEKSDVGGVYIKFYQPVETVDDVVSVNGAGDTFLGVLIAGLASGGKIENLIDVAQRGAIMTVRSPESVSPSLGALKKDVMIAASLGIYKQLRSMNAL